jgi:ribosome-associated protein
VSVPRPPLAITSTLSIPFAELEFVASRSGGPGGQNVNKVSSRVTLRFDLVSSPSLEQPERERLLAVLGSRVNNEGIFQLSAQAARTQGANRKAVVERFVTLLRNALTPRAERRPTRPSRAAKQRRLVAKRREGERKRARQGPGGDDGA